MSWVWKAGGACSRKEGGAAAPGRGGQRPRWRELGHLECERKSEAPGSGQGPGLEPGVPGATEGSRERAVASQPEGRACPDTNQ